MSVLSYLEDLASNAILKEDEKSSIEKSINTLKLRLDNYFIMSLKNILNLVLQLEIQYYQEIWIAILI